MKKSFDEKIEKRKKILKGIVIGLSSTVFSFLAFYLLIALTQNPHFIIRDFQEKYAKVAGTSAIMDLNVRFTGPPGKPTLSAVAGCSSTNPYVNLSWTATSDTNDYDLQRNSLPLIIGVTDISYQDTAVTDNTTYIYKVTANGPLGNTDSDEVSVTTGDCALNVPVTLTINRMNKRQLSSYDGTPETKDHFPEFSGNSNTANALVDIYIIGKTSIIANTTTNSNGYWTWESPFKLNNGTHTILVIATDPLNPLRYGSDSLLFKIVEEEETEKTESKEEVTEAIPPIIEIPGIQLPEPTIIPPEETEKITPPFALNTTVTNPRKEIFSGQPLELETKIIHYDDSLKNFTIQYEILDENGNVVESFSQNISSSKNETINKETSLVPLSKTGKYKVIVKTFYDGFNISSEDYFLLMERPVVNLGGGFIFTLTELLQSISWLISILLTFLLFFILMLIIEHYMSEKALVHITEDFLRNKGFFGKGKGGAE